MSDGETREEAAHNVQDATAFWLEAAEDMRRAVPTPGSARGEWRQRVPKTLHEKLKRLAEVECVSLNALVTSVLAERVGRSQWAAPLRATRQNAQAPQRIAELVPDTNFPGHHFSIVRRSEHANRFDTPP